MYLHKTEIGGKFGVCSRNLELKEDGGGIFWNIAKSKDIETKLRSLNRNLAIQGEVIGPGVQGNKYELSELDFYVHNVWDIDNQRHLLYKEAVELIESIGLKWCPLAAEPFEITESTTYDDLYIIAEKPSILNPKIPEEGVVFREYEESPPRFLTEDEEHFYMRHNIDRASWKIINKAFALKYGH